MFGKKVYRLPLDGIDISRKAAVELVARMNKHWPGEYWLDWPEQPYSNNMLNPCFSKYSAGLAARNYASFPLPDPFEKYQKVEGWGAFPQ